MFIQFSCLFTLVSLVAGAALEHKDLLQGVKTFRPRIVGGSVCHVAQYPHQINLRSKTLNCPECAFTHRCGGSIMDEETIITAAHCIIAMVPSQFQVVAGSNHRSGSDGQIVRVKEIIMHEKYNSETFDNDIAILILSSPLVFNNFTVNKVELAHELPREGAMSKITGWGNTEYQGFPSEYLQEVTVPIVGNALCDSDYGGNRITDSMLCAGVRGVGGKDACNGDSGGPLHVNGKLAGIVSWGIACALPRYPGVYANVAVLRPWVEEKIALQKLKRSSFS